MATPDLTEEVLALPLEQRIGLAEVLWRGHAGGPSGDRMRLRDQHDPSPDSSRSPLSSENWKHLLMMISIRFPNNQSDRRALGSLAGRFSFKSWATGVMIVPEEALAFLTAQGIAFIVEGPATYQQMVPGSHGAYATDPAMPGDGESTP